MKDLRYSIIAIVALVGIAATPSASAFNQLANAAQLSQAASSGGQAAASVTMVCGMLSHLSF